MTGSAFGDVTVIVREAGERTLPRCIALLQELIGEQAVHRVSARPFSKTLRQSLELGMKCDRPWTLCVDADVLVFPDLVTLVADARALPQDVFAVQGLVFDKLMCCRRPAGNHLYRTKLLPRALTLIPAEPAVRPETAMILAMSAQGSGLRQTTHLVGLHDFGQSYADLYAKAYLHAHKHSDLLDLYRPLWQQLAPGDFDYAVALQALEDALQERQTPRVCRDFTDSLLEQHAARRWEENSREFDPASVSGFLAIALDPRHAAAQYRQGLQERFGFAPFPDRLGAR